LSLFSFRSARAFEGAGLVDWDVSSVKTFYYAFYQTDVFNEDISSWNVASATNLESMVCFSLDLFFPMSNDVGDSHYLVQFYLATAFNQVSVLIEMFQMLLLVLGASLMLFSSLCIGHW
jgi:Mycoplasma protein of unknown function, DUF285